MSPIARRLAAIAVLLLSVAIVAVLGLWSLGVPIAIGPDASPSPPPATATPSQPSGSPTASADPLEVFAEIEAEVEDLRDLAAADIGPPDVISREELADELEEVLAETWTDEELARDNLVLRALGLLTEEQDIRDLTQELYAAQVLGFYDFDERRMVVVSDTGLTAEARLIYAHEYAHALQDAAFDIGAAREDEDQLADDDVALARVALEEGDATAVMFEWALDGNLTPAELLGISATPLPDMSAIPEWMVQQLTFPYTAGFEFVSQLQLSGGWSAVDAAYDDPPASTEQVMHPQKYLDAEAPIELEGTDVAAALGDGWEEVEATTIGEATLAIWLSHLGVEAGDARDAATGWGGDELRVARGPDGEWALAWSVAFDTPAHATAFQEAHADITGLELPADLLETSDTEVLLLHASSQSVLDELVAAAR